jgi:glycosyltransferase involved in cell wall biosynthesis
MRFPSGSRLHARLADCGQCLRNLPSACGGCCTASHSTADLVHDLDPHLGQIHRPPDLTHAAPNGSPYPTMNRQTFSRPKTRSQLSPNGNLAGTAGGAVWVTLFGIADWVRGNQRSHRIAEALTAQYPVLFVNPCYYSAIGYIRDTVSGERKRTGLFSVQNPREGLVVATLPPLLPGGLSRPTIGRLNHALLNPLMRRVLDQLDIRSPILWLSLPPDRALLGKLGECLSVYDCMDLHAAFRRGGAARRLAREEEKLLRECDIVLASSRGLKAHCSQFNDHVYLVPNGVDATWFQSQASRSRALIPGLNASQRVIGYVGTIGPWVDTDLLVDLAETHPEEAIVIVGPVQADLSDLVGRRNVHVLGERPYQDVPGLVAQFDVCLLPFHLNDLTQDVNPIKLYEYFSLGKPVVSTALPEVEAFRDVAYVAYSASGFLRGVGQALSEDDVALHQQRMRIASENTWAVRAQQVRRILTAHVQAK